MKQTGKKSVSFIVDGEVIGKGRPRFTGYSAVTPQKTKTYEKIVGYSYMTQAGVYFDCPVEVKIDTYRALPKSKRKLKSEIDALKPDVDNIAKVVLDALNGIAYKDDSQVIKLTITKHPREVREEFMRVTITEAASIKFAPFVEWVYYKLNKTKGVAIMAKKVYLINQYGDKVCDLVPDPSSEAYERNLYQLPERFVFDMLAIGDTYTVVEVDE